MDGVPKKKCEILSSLLFIRVFKLTEAFVCHSGVLVLGLGLAELLLIVLRLLLAVLGLLIVLAILGWLAGLLLVDRLLLLNLLSLISIGINVLILWQRRIKVVLCLKSILMYNHFLGHIVKVNNCVVRQLSKVLDPHLLKEDIILQAHIVEKSSDR